MRSTTMEKLQCIYDWIIQSRWNKKELDKELKLRKTCLNLISMLTLTLSIRRYKPEQ